MALSKYDTTPKARQSSSKNVINRLSNTYWNSGAALIISAAFLFSCTSLAVKLNGGTLPTFELVLVPGVICFLATTVAVRSCGLSVRNHSWRITILTLLRGLLGSTSITCFYLAIELLPLQDAVTIFFCSPVVASLLEFVVTGESHGWAGAAATGCTVLGVVLVSQPECIFHHGAHGHGHMTGGGGGSGTSAAGVALATCAAIANAAAFVVVRLIDRAQSTLVLTWWYHGVVVAVSAVPLALGYPAPAVTPSRRGWALLTVVGATQFVGQLLLNRGFQLESATRGSAINVLQVLFSFVWDMAVLGDKPGPVGMAGSSLVAAGVIFMAATGKAPTPPPPSPHHPHSSASDDGEPDDEDGDLEQPGAVVAVAAATVPVLLQRSSFSTSRGSSGRAAAAGAWDGAGGGHGRGGHGGGLLEPEVLTAGQVSVEVADAAAAEAWVRERQLRWDSARGSVSRSRGDGSSRNSSGGGDGGGVEGASEGGAGAGTGSGARMLDSGTEGGDLRQPLLLVRAESMA